jgi:hypothetical protein
MQASHPQTTRCTDNLCVPIARINLTIVDGKSLEKLRHPQVNNRSSWAPTDQSVAMQFSNMMP